RSQRRDELSLMPLEVTLARTRCALDALRTHEPAERPPLPGDRLLQEDQSLEQGVGARWTARYIDVHRQKAVDALDDTVDVVHASGIRTGAHGDDPARLEHLVIEALDHRCHLQEHRARDDDEIRLPRCRAQHLGAEAGDVELTGEGGRHLDVAAGEPEIERPEGVLLSPGDDVLKPREYQMALHRLLERAARAPARGWDRGPVRRGIQAAVLSGCGFLRWGRVAQSSAPIRQRYASAATRTPMKTRISMYPGQPTSLKAMAHANTYTASRSKIT